MPNPRQFLIITYEAAYELTSDSAEEIRHTLDELRSYAAARATASKLLLTQEEYDEWYRTPGIHEIEVPVPSIVRFD